MVCLGARPQRAGRAPPDLLAMTGHPNESMQNGTCGRVIPGPVADGSLRLRRPNRVPTPQTKNCAGQVITPAGADLVCARPIRPIVCSTGLIQTSSPTRDCDADASGRFPLRGVPTVPVAARGAGRNQNMYGVVLRAGRPTTDKRYFGYTRYLAPQPAWLQTGAGTCGTRTMEQPHDLLH